MVSQQAVLNRRATLRTLAFVLAIGGVLWSLFCAVFIAIGQVERTLPVFGPGYVITIGYVIRALMKNPSETLLRLRFIRAMWLVSAIIQAAWLIPFGFVVFTHPEDPTLRSPFILATMDWMRMQRRGITFGGTWNVPVTGATGAAVGPPLRIRVCEPWA